MEEILNSTLNVSEESIAVPEVNIDPVDEVFISMFCIIIIIMGLVGNILVMYVLGYKRRGKRRSKSESLFVLLASTDFVTSLSLPVLISHRYIWGGLSQTTYKAVCLSAETIASINTTVSQGILVLICMERFRGITRPMSSNMTASFIAAMVIFSHVLAVGIMIPFWLDGAEYCTIALHLQVSKELHRPNEFGLVIHASASVLRDIMSLLIMGYLIFRMVRELKVTEGSFQGRVGDRKRKFSQARKLLLVVIVLFAVCILPDSTVGLSIHTMVYTSYISDKPSLLARLLRATIYLKILLTFNSVINPVIYTFMHPRFIWYRSKIKAIAKKWFCCQEEMVTEMTSSFAASPKLPRGEKDNKAFEDAPAVCNTAF